MKTTAKISTALMVAFLFSISTIGFAQGKKEKNAQKENKKEMVFEKEIIKEKGERDHGSMGIKDLTEDQKEKIKKLKFLQKKEMLSLKNKIEEKKAHLKTLETEDNADMGAINKTIEEMGSLKTEMMKKRAATKQEIRKLLTEEQRLQFDTKQNKKNKKGKKGKKNRENFSHDKMFIKQFNMPIDGDEMEDNLIERKVLEDID